MLCYKNLGIPRKNFAKYCFNATQNQQKYNLKYIFGKLIKIQLIFSRQTTTRPCQVKATKKYGHRV